MLTMLGRGICSLFLGDIIDVKNCRTYSGNSGSSEFPEVQVPLEVG